MSSPCQTRIISDCGANVVIIPDEGEGGGSTSSNSSSFNGTTPEIYLELLSSGMASPKHDGPTPWETYVPFDPSDYDGIVSLYFEVIGLSYYTSASEREIKLVDTSGTVYETITIPVGDGTDIGDMDWVRQRVSIVTPTSPVTFAVKFPIVVADSYQNFITTARIVVRQTGATKTMIQIPLVSFPDWNIGTSFGGGNNPVSYGDSTNDPVHPNTWTNKWNLNAHDPPYEYAYANDYLQIWKYDAAELETVKSLRLDAIAGQQVYGGYWGPQNTIGGSPGDSIVGGLYREDSGNYYLVPGTTTSYIEWSIPYSEHSIDPGDFVAGSDYYYGYRINGAPIAYNYWFTFQPYYFDPAEEMLGMSWRTHPFGMYIGMETLPANTEAMSLCLYDRTADAPVSGMELTWGAFEFLQLKVATIPGSVLVDGHEYEVRCKTTKESYYSAPVLSKATIYLTIDPISRLTVWQRVMRGNQYWGWGYYGTWGQAYSEWGDPCVCSYARTQFFAPSWAAAKYELTGTFYWWPTVPFDGDIDYCYQALWDHGSNDSYDGGGGSLVDGSQIAWTLADQDNNERKIKRSDCLTLTDDVRYCDIQPEGFDWLYPAQGFLVVGHVTGCVLPPGEGGGGDGGGGNGGGGGKPCVQTIPECGATVVVIP